MKITISTKVGIWAVQATAGISLNPYRHDEGEDWYQFESFTVRTVRGVCVRQWLTEKQIGQIVDALISEYHETRAEAEYRYAA